MRKGYGRIGESLRCSTDCGPVASDPRLNLVEQTAIIRALLIAPDAELRAAVLQPLSEVDWVAVARKLDSYPEELDLERAIRTHLPHVLLIDVQSLERGLETVRLAERLVPGIQAVALTRSCDPQVIIDVMRTGVRELLTPPFAARQVLDSMDRVRGVVEARPPVFPETGTVYTFLPAKQGVGASTVALNTAAALSRDKHTKAFLADFDMSNGIIGFMLKLDGRNSVVEAAENAHHLDHSLWTHLVSRAGELEVMHSGPVRPGFRIETGQVRQIIEYARRDYSTVCVDLSGNLERYSIEAMQESTKLLVVVTPEITSLHLARERLEYLKGLGLSDRVALVLNRYHRTAVVKAQQVEDLLGSRVISLLPNDYRGVQNAVQVGRPVEADSELGRQFRVLSEALLGRKRLEETKEESSNGLKGLMSFLGSRPAPTSREPAAPRA